MAPEPSTAPEPWALCRSHPGFIGAQQGDGGLSEGRASLPAPRLEMGVPALSSSLSAGSRGRDLGPGPQWGLALISSEGSIFRSPHPAFLGVVWWPEQGFALPLLSCACGRGSSPAHPCVSPECWTLCSTNEEEERERRDGQTSDPLKRSHFLETWFWVLKTRFPRLGPCTQLVFNECVWRGEF